MRMVFGRPECLADMPHHMCAGCGHAITARLLAEVIDELGVREDTIIVAGPNCLHFLMPIIRVDRIRCLHGREPAVATGIKRVQPDKLVIVMAGDGALGGIGIGEITHAAARGEHLTTLMLNNAALGDTGGQKSAITVLGQKTRDTPLGRDENLHGHPVRIADMIAMQPGASYVARVAVHTPLDVIRAKEAIRRACETQMYRKGLAFVDILEACPAGWAMTPKDALNWLAKTLIPEFPLGELKSLA